MTIKEFTGEYRWLSNFWRAPIVYGGIDYPTTEHAYQASKSSSISERRAISLYPKATQAKSHGKAVYHPRKDFDKLQVMLEVNRLKYKIPDLKEKLLDTGEREIIEGNTWGDKFWGVCEGFGENHLGKILMKIREELINEQR